jgi:hypothetical protein
MRILIGILMMCTMPFLSFMAVAQRQGGRESSISASADARNLISRMMAFDRSNDGKLTGDEVTDERLIRLFERADADMNGAVTEDELNALAQREHADEGGGPSGFGFGGPPPGGGRGGGPMMGMTRPGEILPQFLRQRLNLSAKQQKQLTALQKKVDDELAQILTAAQKKQLAEMRSRGPGGFGLPGGPRGGGPPPGGPGGPPLDGPPPDGPPSGGEPPPE